MRLFGQRCFGTCLAAGLCLAPAGAADTASPAELPAAANVRLFPLIQDIYNSGGGFSVQLAAGEGSLPVELEKRVLAVSGRPGDGHRRITGPLVADLLDARGVGRAATLFVKPFAAERSIPILAASIDALTVLAVEEPDGPAWVSAVLLDMTSRLTGIGKLDRILAGVAWVARDDPFSPGRDGAAVEWQSAPALVPGGSAAWRRTGVGEFEIFKTAGQAAPGDEPGERVAVFLRRGATTWRLYDGPRSVGGANDFIFDPDPVVVPLRGAFTHLLVFGRDCSPLDAFVLLGAAPARAMVPCADVGTGE